MTAQIIIQELKVRDIQVWAEGDKLKLDAPSGLLTTEDLNSLAEHKAELLVFLNPPKRRKEITVQGTGMPKDRCCFDDCKGKPTRLGVNSWTCAECGYLIWLKPIEDEELTKLWQNSK